MSHVKCTQTRHYKWTQAGLDPPEKVEENTIYEKILKNDLNWSKVEKNRMYEKTKKNGQINQRFSKNAN